MHDFFDRVPQEAIDQAIQDEPVTVFAAMMELWYDEWARNILTAGSSASDQS